MIPAWSGLSSDWRLLGLRRLDSISLRGQKKPPENDRCECEEHDVIFAKDNMFLRRQEFEIGNGGIYRNSRDGYTFENDGLLSSLHSCRRRFSQNGD